MKRNTKIHNGKILNVKIIVPPSSLTAAAFWGPCPCRCLPPHCDFRGMSFSIASRRRASLLCRGFWVNLWPAWAWRETSPLLLWTMEWWHIFLSFPPVLDRCPVHCCLWELLTSPSVRECLGKKHGKPWALFSASLLLLHRVHTAWE